MRLLLLSLLLSACASTHGHPMGGPIKIERDELGYFIATHGDEWVVHVHTNDHPHRFQGSLTAVKGGLRDLDLSRPGLSSEVAMNGDQVQFDIDVPRRTDESFRIRAPHDGGCVRFDVYVDGGRRPERVYLGHQKRSPQDVPFERCR